MLYGKTLETRHWDHKVMRKLFERKINQKKYFFFSITHSDFFVPTKCSAACWPLKRIDVWETSTLTSLFRPFQHRCTIVTINVHRDTSQHCSAFLSFLYHCVYLRQQKLVRPSWTRSFEHVSWYFIPAYTCETPGVCFTKLLSLCCGLKHVESAIKSWPR